MTTARAVRTHPHGYEGDCYVRLRENALVDWHRLDTTPGSLVFIDLTSGKPSYPADRGGIREIPPGALVNAPTVLVRLPDQMRVPSGEDGEPFDIGSLAAWDDEDDDHGDRAGRRERERQVMARDLALRIGERGFTPPRVGLVGFPLGEPPTIVWSEASEADDAALSRLLQRARRIELEALVEWNDVVAQPKGYHYRLPSGHHTRFFVRTGDLFRDVRAAGSLSTWLRAGLDLDHPTIIVLDTGSLSPLAAELNGALRACGQSNLTVQSMDRYPQTTFEYRRALGHGVTGSVLAVLSVSSTGDMRRRLEQTLGETVADGRWSIEPLLDRRGREATGVPLETSRGTHEAWLGLRDLHDPTRDADQCDLCREPDVARLVTIDPWNFAAKTLPEPELLVPQVGDGHQNRSLWDHYHALGGTGAGDRTAISLAGPTRPGPRRHGQSGKVYFEPSLLLERDLEQVIRERLTELRAGLLPMRPGPAARKEVGQLQEVATRMGEVDLVVVDVDDITALTGKAAPTPEQDEAARSLLGGALARAINGPGAEDLPVVVAPRFEEGRAAVLLEVAHRWVRRPVKPTILLFSLGVRMGVTLQSLLADIHTAWAAAGEEPVVKGLVIHAHPETARAWAGVRNAFRRGTAPDLLALWLTYVPHRSPHEDELLLLERAEKLPALTEEQEQAREQGQWMNGRSTALTRVARNVLDQRVAVLRREGHESSDTAPFWGPSELQLRRTSYYGDELSARVTMMAVGAAMQRARLLGTAGGPTWFRFDLPKVFRSYFDGLIHVSVLRWLEPHEGWWGETEQDQLALLQEIEHQSPADWPLVLTELLLAAAQGKTPPSFREQLIAGADRLLASPNAGDVYKELALLGKELVAADLASTRPP